MKDFVLSEPWFWVIPNWVQFVLIVVIAYLVGCFHFARFYCWIKKKDVSKMGSGNPGAMNMIRNFGAGIGFLTFFFDAFKAGIPTIIVYHLYNVGSYSGGIPTGAVFAETQFPVGCFAAFLCGVCVVLGHVFPATSKFKGGKGISSGVGLFWLMLGMANPWFWLIGFGFILTWPVTISLTKAGSICSMSYLAGFGIWQIGVLFNSYGTGSLWSALCVAFIFGVVALSWVAHHKNIRCLMSGEEHETVLIKKKKKKV